MHENRISKFQNCKTVKLGKGQTLIHTNNGSESLNSVLNNSFADCSDFNQILAALKKFKIEQIIRFDEQYTDKKYPKMRTDTIIRHERLHAAIQQYDSFNIIQNNYTLIDTAIFAGWLMCSIKK